MFVLQAVLFLLLPRVHSFGLFTALACVILLCYGGGFGTMPAFCADYFGPRDVGAIYGLMLTAWGCGSALGPILIAHVRQSTGRYEQALLTLAALMAGAAVIPFFLKAPTRADAAGPTDSGITRVPDAADLKAKPGLA
jgi:OFA family oxalate/formate antiporter-like MFS transporter